MYLGIFISNLTAYIPITHGSRIKYTPNLYLHKYITRITCIKNKKQKNVLISAYVSYCDIFSHKFRPVIRPPNTRRRHIPQCDVSTALHLISTWYSAIQIHNTRYF